MDTETYNSALSSLVQMTERDGKEGQGLDKKTRREIANSNERRRMQSINTGFMRLKALVPTISKEKVSKVTTQKCTIPRAKEKLSVTVKLGHDLAANRGTY